VGLLRGYGNAIVPQLAAPGEDALDQLRGHGGAGPGRSQPPGSYLSPQGASDGGITLSTRALKHTDRAIQRRIVAKIEMLQDNPRPAWAVKLTGHEAYRIRIGDYRVIYAIESERLIVLVVEIGHRREVYRDW
jgi:mRNA interferase RelE/StbE